MTRLMNNTAQTRTSDDGIHPWLRVNLRTPSPWHLTLGRKLLSGWNTSRSIDLAYERCDGKKAAVEAIRRLLAENVCKFGR